jgi:hypothetical protein
MLNADAALPVEKISEFVSFDANTGDITRRVARNSFRGPSLLIAREKQVSPRHFKELF